MLILGLILILAAAALATGVVYDGSESASVELFGVTVDTTIAGVFFTGAAAMLVLLVGVWMISATVGRSRRKRRERKLARRQQRDSVNRLEDERSELRAENDRLHERLGADGTRGEGAAATGTAADGRVITPEPATGAGGAREGGLRDTGRARRP